MSEREGGGVTHIFFMRNYIFFITLFLLAGGVAVPAEALTVSPAKVEIQADPGQTVHSEIELFNEQSDTRIFFTSFENFESRGDSGAPYFTGAKSGLATWLSAAPEISIATGERIKIPYTISIPASAKPGGYFAAVFFGSQPPQSTVGGEVSIGGKIGVLILLRVNGEVEESAGLVDFGAKDGRRFFVSLPVPFEYGFNNTGGDRVVPQGELVIRNTFRLKSATLLANEREGSVLPNSTRRFETLWGEAPARNEANEEIQLGFFRTAFAQVKNFHFGWYTAKLNLSWGASAQTANASYNFFIIPWQLLLIFLVLLFIFWFLLKRYNRYIIARATRQQ